MPTSSPELLHHPPHLEARDFNETDRLYYDTTTWLAEVLPGQMRTDFEYSFDGHELYGRDGGALKPIFDTAIIDAERLAKNNSKLAFERRRRHLEKGEYNDMLSMEKGELPNTMVVISDFPEELMDAVADVGGYNVSRKQTMLRVITKNPDGKIVMHSQSLDRTDRKSLEAISEYLGFKLEPGELLGQRMHVDLPQHEQEFLADWLTGVYDRSMSSQYGGEWYAGRTPAEMQNTYDFVRSQRDLIETFMQQTMVHGRDESLQYGLAAAMVSRFKNKSGSRNHVASPNYIPEQVLNEMGSAGNQARLLGKVFSGCGDTNGPEGLQTTEGQLDIAGYGNKSSEDKYGSLKFKCQKGHENTREVNKLLDKCKTCGINVRCK